MPQEQQASLLIHSINSNSTASYTDRNINELEALPNEKWNRENTRKELFLITSDVILEQLSFLSQAHFEILISEFTNDFAIAVFAFHRNRWQWHAVKRICFNHGVDRHVFKYETVPFFQRLIEGVVANDVTRQTCLSAQTVQMGLLPASPEPINGGRYGISSTSGIWQVAEVSKMAISMPFLWKSRTEVTR